MAVLESRTVKVLLIEDNEDDYAFTRDLLMSGQNYQYELDWVSSYEAGLAAVITQQHDVYLLDHHLDQAQTGLDLLRQAKLHPCPVPIILLTDSVDRRVEQEAMELGAIDFLCKPEMTVNDLERSLRYAIRQRKAEADLQQTSHLLVLQAKRERLIWEITQHIRASLDLDTILKTTVSEVRQLLTVDRVVIYRFNADGSGNIIVESVIDPVFSILGQTVADCCFGANGTSGNYLYWQGRVSLIEDVNSARGILPCYAKLLHRFQIRANLVVPIWQGEVLWGLMVAHHCTAPRSWLASEIDLLTQIAGQVAIAIQQSELYRQIQQLNTNLEQQVQHRTLELQTALDFESTLQRITDRVRDSLDEDHILQAAIEELVKALQASACDVRWYDLEQKTVTVRYECLESPTIPPALGTVLPIEGMPDVHEQLLRGHWVQFCLNLVTFEHPRHPERWLSILACPLADEQKVLGNIWVFKPAAHSFSPSEIRLVQQVANQCVIALRQAFLYRAVQSQVEQLASLNRMKDEFLNTISHELRTPMSNIKMALQLLELVLERQGLLYPGSAANQYFQILREESDQEIRLINDLLDLAQLDGDLEPLDYTSIDPYAWIPHIAEPFLERARQQQQTLHIVLPPNLPLLITNLESLERILTELLQNACKYTPPKEQIYLTVQPTPDQLQICVTNTGVEIPASECSRVFDRFYRVPSNDPWKHDGIGLGLALVKKRVVQLGGTVGVESGKGQVRFVVTLPVG